MIVVEIDAHGLKVSGHAVTGAPPGQNIVCAAVSALTLTLIEGLENIAKAEIVSATVLSGEVVLRWSVLDEIGRALVDTWYLGIVRIKENYGHIEIR